VKLSSCIEDKIVFSGVTGSNDIVTRLQQAQTNTVKTVIPFVVLVLFQKYYSIDVSEQKLDKELEMMMMMQFLKIIAIMWPRNANTATVHFSINCISFFQYQQVHFLLSF